MNVYKTGLPSYETLKALPTDNSYVFHLFEVFGTGCIRLTYNEDGYKQISLDYLEGGYLNYVYIPGAEIKLNYFYDLNKDNYSKIVKVIKRIKSIILENLKEVVYD